MAIYTNVGTFKGQGHTLGDHPGTLSRTILGHFVLGSRGTTRFSSCNILGRDANLRSRVVESLLTRLHPLVHAQRCGEPYESQFTDSR